MSCWPGIVKGVAFSNALSTYSLPKTSLLTWTPSSNNFWWSSSKFVVADIIGSVRIVVGAETRNQLYWSDVNKTLAKLATAKQPYINTIASHHDYNISSEQSHLWHAYWTQRTSAKTGTRINRVADGPRTLEGFETHGAARKLSGSSCHSRICLADVSSGDPAGLASCLKKHDSCARNIRYIHRAGLVRLPRKHTEATPNSYKRIRFLYADVFRDKALLCCMWRRPTPIHNAGDFPLLQIPHENQLLISLNISPRWQWNFCCD